MAIEVQIPTILRTYTGGESEVSATGANQIHRLRSNRRGMRTTFPVRGTVPVYVGSSNWYATRIAPMTIPFTRMGRHNKAVGQVETCDERSIIQLPCQGVP